jgi:hypothetical protein
MYNLLALKNYYGLKIQIQNFVLVFLGDSWHGRVGRMRCQISNNPTFRNLKYLNFQPVIILGHCRRLHTTPAPELVSGVQGPKSHCLSQNSKTAAVIWVNLLSETTLADYRNFTRLLIRRKGENR